MKYVRKVTALVLSIIFCAAIVIGIGIIYSVKNVNVEFIDYTGKYTEEFENTKNNLKKLKGSGMLFISAGDVSGKISDKGVLAIESYERVYPCTVNVVVKERVECFIIKSFDVISVYDEDGALMRTDKADGGVYLNPSDNSPDITVNTESVAVKLSAKNLKSVASLCMAVKQSFGSLRKLVDNVTVYVSVDTANIKLRSGLSIAVSGWENNAEGKIAAVYEIYKNLSDKQRTGGIISVRDGSAGTQPTANYS